MTMLRNIFVIALLANCVASVSADEAMVMSSPVTSVTQEDIDRYIVENIPSDEAQRSALFRKPGFFREMAESLFIVRALAREGEEALRVDPEQARWSAELSYQRKLVARYREHYLLDVFKDVNWDTMAKEAYNAQTELYVKGPTVSASHVLVSMVDRTQAEALQRIQLVHKKAVAGEDFAKLADEYSDDPSAEKNSGDLGEFGRKQMAPAFERAAFALENPGDISEPVRTSFGYHVIKLNAKHPLRKIPFEEAKPQIIDELQTQFGSQAWRDKIVKLRSSPDLKLNPEALEALEKKYAPPVDADAK